MATWTPAVSASTTVQQTSLTSASFTPAAGDLLVAVGIVTGGNIGNFTDSQNLGGIPWRSHLLAEKNSNGDQTEIAIADGFAAAIPTTVTLEVGGNGISCTGIAFCV